MSDDFTLVQSEAEYTRVLAALEGRGRFAIDTEFVRERTFFPVLALVQIAWEGGLALLDPFELDMQRLRPLFESKALAVTHACSQDLPILEAAIGVRPSRLFDTQIAGAFLGHGVPSLGAIVERTLGVKLAKGDQLADWTRRPLDPRTRRYAASDVLHLLELHDALGRELEQRGRLAWAEEECEIALQKASVRPLDEAWWRLKGKAKLRGSARGVAQALARFRLEEAAERNVPVKRVLSDMAILAMANRPPKKPRDLERIRGMHAPKANFARRVIAAVERGLSLEGDGLCLPPKRKGGDEQRAAATLCGAWLAQLSAAHGIDMATLATRDDIEHWLRGSPSRLDSGWRHELTHEAMGALKEGKAALRLDEGELSLVMLG
ncbi:MAG: HRDC domain-containing protein [Myxococcota bacterium]